MKNRTLTTYAILENIPSEETILPDFIATFARSCYPGDFSWRRF